MIDYAPLLLCLALISSRPLPRTCAPRTSARRPRRAAGAIPARTNTLKIRDADVRVEAVKQLTRSAPRTSRPADARHADNDAEVQIRATDGLVNFYLPGYVKTGIGVVASPRAVAGIRAKFTDTNDQVIDSVHHGAARRDRGDGQAGARRRQHGRARQCRARCRHSARQGAMPDLVERTAHQRTPT